MKVNDDEIRMKIRRLAARARARPPAVWQRILPYLEDIEDARSRGVRLAELADVLGVNPVTLSRAIRQAREYMQQREETKQ